MSTTYVKKLALSPFASQGFEFGTKDGVVTRTVPAWCYLIENVIGQEIPPLNEYFKYNTFEGKQTRVLNWNRGIEKGYAYNFRRDAGGSDGEADGLPGKMCLLSDL